MGVLIRVFIFLCFLCNVQVFPGVCVFFPNHKIYFSKKVLNSGVIRSKAQLYLAYSYFRNQVCTDFESNVVEKLFQERKVPLQSNFHFAHKSYGALVSELDLIQERFVLEKSEKMNFDYFKSLFKSIMFVQELINCRGDLKLNFDSYKILRANTLKEMQSNKDNLFICYENYFILIDELFDLNDKLLKQKISLPTDSFLYELKTKNTEFAFKSGFLEETKEKGIESSKDYLFVYFTKIIN